MKLDLLSVFQSKGTLNSHPIFQFFIEILNLNFAIYFSKITLCKMNVICGSIPNTMRFGRHNQPMLPTFKKSNPKESPFKNLIVNILGDPILVEPHKNRRRNYIH